MDESSKPGLEREFKRLERRLDELVGVVAQLKEENRRCASARTRSPPSGRR